MKKNIFFSLVFLFCSSFLFAQNSSHEFGILIGTSNYLGDLQTRNFTLEQRKAGYGFFYKKNFGHRVSVKLFVNNAPVKAEDAKTGNKDLIKRNLSFKTNIWELGTFAEINVMKNNFTVTDYDKGKKRYFGTPYFFVGINAFKYNPKTYFNNQWIALQPLGTEGQGTSLNKNKKYELTQIAIPFGVGYKYDIFADVSLCLEFGMRKTFTDYLDDVSGKYVNPNDLLMQKSQLAADLSYRGDELSNFDGFFPLTGEIRGNANNKDWYFLYAATLSYKFNRKK